MRAFALAELADDLAIDVLSRKEDAYASLNDVLADEPRRVDILYVAPIELDAPDLSAN